MLSPFATGAGKGRESGWQGGRDEGGCCEGEGGREDGRQGCGRKRRRMREARGMEGRDVADGGGGRRREELYRDAAEERIGRKVEGKGKTVEVYRVQWGRESAFGRKKEMRKDKTA